MSSSKVVECPICKEPYVVYMFTSADQSACYNCVRVAHEKKGKIIGINEKFK